MAGVNRTPKSKSMLNIGGFEYLSQGHRKDGSTTWRCADKDCEGRLLKKGDEDIELLKEHSTELPSIKAAVIHLGMNCIKEHALNNPKESAQDIIKAGMLKASELMVAFMPSPSVIEDNIKEWTETDQKKTRKEKNSKGKDKSEGRPRRNSIKLPAKTSKKMRFSSAEDMGSDDEEIPTSRSKRSRSKVMEELDESDDE